jgi:hypothetical protein
MNRNFMRHLVLSPADDISGGNGGGGTGGASGDVKDGEDKHSANELEILKAQVATLTQSVDKLTEKNKELLKEKQDAAEKARRELELAKQKNYKQAEQDDDKDKIISFLKDELSSLKGEAEQRKAKEKEERSKYTKNLIIKKFKEALAPFELVKESYLQYIDLASVGVEEDDQGNVTLFGIEKLAKQIIAENPELLKKKEGTVSIPASKGKSPDKKDEIINKLKQAGFSI